MVTPEPIRVRGLREFGRNLRALDAGLPKAIRLAGNAAAALVVREAKPRVPRGPARGGHAADSIKAASTRTAARVAAGSRKHPYYAWLDFGGRVGPGGSVRRPFIKSGRYIWKAYADRRADIARTLEAELTDVARSAGMDPT